jgi:hypothetical protein
MLRKEILEAFEILVRGSLAAVQCQEPDCPRTDALGPDMVLAVHLNHLDAAGFDFVHRWDLFAMSHGVAALELRQRSFRRGDRLLVQAPLSQVVPHTAPGAGRQVN